MSIDTILWVPGYLRQKHYEVAACPSSRFEPFRALVNRLSSAANKVWDAKIVVARVDGSPGWQKIS